MRKEKNKQDTIYIIVIPNEKGKLINLKSEINKGKINPLIRVILE